MAEPSTHSTNNQQQIKANRKQKPVEALTLPSPSGGNVVG
jgi:hypothetical protein